VFRGSGGTSLTIPFASQVSGLTTVTPTTSSTTFAAPNPQLQAEVVAAYDVGTDIRLHDGTIFSADLYNNVVHNAWITQNQLLAAPPAGFAAGGTYFLSSTFNGPEEHSQGFEINIARLPLVGFGYNLSTSFNRTYYLNLSAAYLGVATKDFNGAQQYGQPFSKGYLNLQYADSKEQLFRFGVDYEGPGNSANAQSYVVLDAGIRVKVPFGVAFQAAVENLSNLSFGGIGHAVAFQGVVPVQIQLVNNQFVYNNGPARGISNPFPRTVRFSLTKKL
jgi:outer membrane receptor protein involved in Fe transport